MLLIIYEHFHFGQTFGGKRLNVDDVCCRFDMTIRTVLLLKPFCVYYCKMANKMTATLDEPVCRVTRNSIKRKFMSSENGKSKSIAVKVEAEEPYSNQKPANSGVKGNECFLITQFILALF